MVVKEHTVSVSDFVDIRNCLEFLFPLLGIHIRRIRGGANRRENIALVTKNKRVLRREDYFINRLNKEDTEFSCCSSIYWWRRQWYGA